MGQIAITGAVGEVRWSYRVVATLAAWTLVAEPAGTGVTQVLTAQVTRHDAFAVSQRPLMFVVPRPKGHHWRWPIESLQIANGTLTASLGSQE